jgi:radical SAM superfamily enzyme YgiQ (UPF0313 family)
MRNSRHAQLRRVLLVAPTALDDAGQPILQNRLYLPGLTLPILAALAPEDVEVSFCFESVQRIPYNEDWDLVGITGMGSGIVRAWEIADRFRALGVPVVIGGVAATLLGAEASLEHADAVVLGEAEATWPRLLEDLRNGGMRRVYEATAAPRPEDLPVPRYDLLPRWKLGPWRAVQATRGCPFACDFCSVTSFFSQRYQKRPVAHVIRDIRACGSRFVAFIDDNIGVDWEWCAELWEALVPERITWMSQCTLHIAERPDLLDLAYRSGCRLLSIGIESVNRNSLESHGKHWNHPDRYGEMVQTIRDHGIEVSTEMMVGLEGDGQGVFQDTFDFLMDNQIAVPRIHILTPVPGTPLHTRLSGDGRIVNDELDRYTGGSVVFTPSGIDPVLLLREYWSLYERLFTLKGIWHRTWRNQAALGPFMRAFVVGVNLHYRRHIKRRITPGIV